MLHIILGILKIIGIILLVLIGLVLLITASVLLVPVRYQLTARKQDPVIYGQAKITWLLHLISFSAEYKEKHPVMTIRIFGIDLQKLIHSMHNKKKPPTGTKKNKVKKRKSDKTASEAVGLPAQPAQQTQPQISSQGIKPARTDLPQREMISDQAAPAQPEMISDQVNPAQREIISDQAAPPRPKMTSEQADVLQPEKLRMSDKIQKILSKFKQIVSESSSKIRQMVETLQQLPQKSSDTAEQLQDRLQKGKTKLDSIREQYADETAKEIYRKIWTHLKYIWQHYRPRKAGGWLHFGTGAPDVTGELTGILYLLLPAGAADLEIIPDFNDVVLETEFVVKGHIRAIHLVKTAAAVWFDKDIKKFIRKIRAKGGK